MDKKLVPQDTVLYSGIKAVWYAIASQALAAVMRAYDGRGPPTTLSHAVLKQLHLKHHDDLISWAYADSALVPIVKACAGAGDETERNVLENAVQELALNITSVVRKLKLAGNDGKKTFPLVLVGGVLEKDEGFDLFSAVVECVSRTFPHVQAVRPQVEPAVGAALLAAKQSVTANGKMCAAEALHG